MTFLLQTHDNFTNRGPICQLEASSELITQEYVLRKYGSGYFCVKQNSPRMRPIWKGWIGEPKLKNDLPAGQAREIRALRETTDNLTLGEILLGIGEVAGFGLTGSSLTDHGLRLSRAEAMLYIYNASYPITVLCPTCQHAFSDILGDFCGNCGTKTIWVSLPPAKPGDRACPYCFHPAKQDQNFCTHCGKALPALPSNGSGVRLAPFRPWSLP